MKLKILLFSLVMNAFLIEQLQSQIIWHQLTPKGIIQQDIVGDSFGNIYCSISGLGQVWKSIDNGNSWNMIAHDLPIGNLVLAKKNILLGGSYYNGVLLSVDSGNTWNSIGLESERTVSVVMLDNGKIIAGTYGYTSGIGQIFSTSDLGQTWVAPDSNKFTDIVRCLSKDQDNNVYAGTASGYYKSIDGGKSWCFGGLKYTTVISFLARTNKELYACGNGYYNGFFRSFDGGITWNKLANGSIAEYFLTFAIDSSNTIYLGTEKGVFSSSDNGNTWKAQNNGLTELHINSLFVSRTNYLFAGTDGRGIYRSDSLLTNVLENKDKSEKIFILNQNYPNPFNPSTTISFNLQSQSFVTLKIYDMIGKEVATLINEELSSGLHSRQWNALYVSSGSYYYRLQTNHFSETKKLNYLK